MAPPVPCVQTGFDGDVREQNGLDRSLVSRKKAQAPVGAVNHEVLEHQVSHVVPAITDSHSAGAALDQVGAHADVFGNAFLRAKSRHANAVVSCADIAVGNAMFREVVQ